MSIIMGGITSTSSVAHWLTGSLAILVLATAGDAKELFLLSLQIIGRHEPHLYVLQHLLHRFQALRAALMYKFSSQKAKGLDVDFRAP